MPKNDSKTETKTEFKREVAISKEFLQTIYNGIKSREERYNRLGDALSEISEERVYLRDAATEDLTADVMKTLLGEHLNDDWEYLLYECPAMEGGGSVTVNGKKYRLFDFDSLWTYWTREELV